MSEEIRLQAHKRDEVGKQGLRSVRQQGYVPGVYYDAKGDNIPVQIRYRSLEAAYAKAHSNHVIRLEITNGKSGPVRPVMIWDIQHHPVKDLILHVDFFGVDMSKEIQVEIPVEITGEAPGIQEGGQLTLYHEALLVSCLPDALPEGIQIDVSALEMNENVNIEDVTFPEGVVPVYDEEENFAVVGVNPIMEASLEEEEEAETEESATEAEE